MRGLRATAATVLVLGLSACGRAEPDARFDAFTTPFVRVSATCWPLPGNPSFPWLVRQRTVTPTDTGNRIFFAVQTFETPIAEVAAEVDDLLTGAGYARDEALEATGGFETYLRDGDEVVSRIVAAPPNGVAVTGTLYVVMRPRSIQAGPCHPTAEEGEL